MPDARARAHCGEHRLVRLVVGEQPIDQPVRRNPEHRGEAGFELRLGELLRSRAPMTSSRAEASASEPCQDRVLVETFGRAELAEGRERAARQHTAVVHEQTTPVPVLRTHSA